MIKLLATVSVVTALSVACSDTDETASSPVHNSMTGTWSLTLSPEHTAGDCIAQGVLPDMALPSSFTVRMTAAGPLINEGQSEPGLVEVYTFGRSDLSIDSYYDSGLTGHVELHVTGKTVSGAGSMDVGQTCNQDYSITGEIQ